MFVVILKSGVDHIGVEQGNVGLSKVGGDGHVQELCHAALAVDGSVSRCFLDHGVDGSFVVFVDDRLEICDIVGGILKIWGIDIGIVWKKENFGAVSDSRPVVSFVFVGDVRIW